MVLEKTLESSLDSKEIKPINPRSKSELNIGYSVGRTDAEAETPVLWPPDVRN